MAMERYRKVADKLHELGACRIAVHDLTQETNSVPDQALEFWVLNGHVVIVQHFTGKGRGAFEGIEVYRPCVNSNKLNETIVCMAEYLTRA